MLPKGYSKFDVTVKYSLMSYIAVLDCKEAIRALRTEDLDFGRWKVSWAGICALLNASVHLMRKQDATSCIPLQIRKSPNAKWHELGKNKAKYPIFWDFIDQERNNILKEYRFSPDEVILKADGSLEPKRGLLYMLGENEKSILVIRGGQFGGRPALDVAEEAANWIEEICRRRSARQAMRWIKE